MAVDPPQKVLVSRDADGAGWVSYDDPDCAAKRHGMDAEDSQIVDIMVGVLGGIAACATAIS